MSEFSSIVITTDDGGICLHADVDDDTIQALRRLIYTCFIFASRYKQQGDEVDIEGCRIAEDARDQAADFMFVAHQQFKEGRTKNDL